MGFLSTPSHDKKTWLSQPRGYRQHHLAVTGLSTALKSPSAAVVDKSGQTLGQTDAGADADADANDGPAPSSNEVGTKRPVRFQHRICYPWIWVREGETEPS